MFDSLHFSNSFARLGEDFYRPVRAEPIADARLVSVNPAAAALIDLDDAALASADFMALMAGRQLPPGARPLASVYAGHQFGGYTPQLGDGRALLIGEVQNRQGQRWELQLKGAGQTPYSRFADGRAVLRSSIREYLCSEAMHSLGIPSTRAMALSTGSTPVYRERIEPAAMVLRMAPSHIRFGHFEYFFHSGRHDCLQQLADYVIEQHFPHCAGLPAPARYQQWLLEVVERTARLIADWQAAGFCHGVMNTDNMSILGLTIDYGPFAFIDDFDPGFVCNHSDSHGRYAYNRQVAIGLWNLNALAHALSPLIPVPALKDCLMQYEPVLLARFRQRMQHKLGLATDQPGDDELVGQLLQLLAAERRDYHDFFRRLGNIAAAELATLDDSFVDRERWRSWRTGYRQRLAREDRDDSQRQAAMHAVNPKFVLRNYLAQLAIEKAENGDDSLVNTLLAVLQQPFAEHPAQQALAAPPPDWGKQLEISCSS